MVILVAEKSKIDMESFEKFQEYFSEETSANIYVFDTEIVLDDSTVFAPKVIAKMDDASFAFNAAFFGEVDWMLVAQFVEIAINDHIAKNA